MKRFSSEIFSWTVSTFYLVRRNATLFLGNTLFLLGVFGFSNGKYCDGNAADYYACTNPAAYYYYSIPAITAIVLGGFFLSVWYVKKMNT
jgi:hypothetical protein